jgi:hypothetical protein
MVCEQWFDLGAGIPKRWIAVKYVKLQRMRPRSVTSFCVWQKEGKDPESERDYSSDFGHAAIAAERGPSQKVTWPSHPFQGRLR